MNTEAIITKIRNIIADNTALELTDVYTPALPQEKRDNICAITIVGGIPEYSLCGASTYDLTIRTLICGTTNDTITRALTDSIYKALDLQSDITVGNNKIIQILATTTPIFVGKDEELRNLYNITFNLKGR